MNFSELIKKRGENFSLCSKGLILIMMIIIKEGSQDKISIQDCLKMEKKGYFSVIGKNGGICCFILEELW